MTDNFPSLERWLSAQFDIVDAKLDTIEAKLTEREKALVIALKNFEIRMNGTNEWRASFEDLLKTRVSQETFDALDQRIKRIEEADLKDTAKSAGFGQIGTLIATAVASASAAVAMFKVFS